MKKIRTTARTIEGFYGAILRKPEIGRGAVVLATLAALRVAQAAAERRGVAATIEGFDDVEAALDRVEGRPEAPDTDDYDRELNEAVSQKFRALSNSSIRPILRRYPESITRRELLARVTTTEAQTLAAYYLLWAIHALTDAAWFETSLAAYSAAVNDCRFAAELCALILMACGESQREGATPTTNSADAIVLSAVRSSLEGPERRPNPRGPLWLRERPDRPHRSPTTRSLSPVATCAPDAVRCAMPTTKKKPTPKRLPQSAPKRTRKVEDLSQRIPKKSGAGPRGKDPITPDLIRKIARRTHNNMHTVAIALLADALKMRKEVEALAALNTLSGYTGDRRGYLAELEIAISGKILTEAQRRTTPENFKRLKKAY